MNFLLTNDDGLSSPLIRLLSDRLREEGHKCWVVAPAANRSGQSHSITITQPVVIKEIDEFTFSCSGTPVDCVNYAHTRVINEEKIDLVLSGINLGYNLGSDLIYSGTAAAARQAVFNGYKALALSWGIHDERYFMDIDLVKVTLEEARKKLPDLIWVVNTIVENIVILKDMIEDRSFLNINFPIKKNDSPQWISSALGTREFKNNMTCFKTPHASEYCFFHGEPQEKLLVENTDVKNVSEGNIAYALVTVDPSLKKSPEDLAVQGRPLKA